MPWSKRDLITQAYTEIGLANYVFDLEPEQLQSACNVMDAMIASWGAIGVQIGYAMSDSPSTADINADSGVPDFCNAAIYLNLAVRLAPSMGKNISPDTRMGANQAKKDMLGMLCILPKERQFPSTMPRGQGAKTWNTGGGNPYFSEPDDPLGSDPNEITLNN